jgi:hypothetical protein
VEEQNDSLKVGTELIEIYRDLINQKQPSHSGRCRHWRTLRPRSNGSS